MGETDNWSPPRKISVVVDNNSWILPWAECLVERCRTELGDDAVLHRSYEEVRHGAVAFFLGCTGLAPDEVTKRNTYTLVVHESNLPGGRGFAPLIWQILEDRNRIPVTLLGVSPEPDAGPIYLQTTLEFEGHELHDELRAAQGSATVELCLDFLKSDKPPGGAPQTGQTDWYPRRNPEDSRLDPEASIASQFNLLRVVDNERYPAYFDYRGHRYKVRIEKM